MTQLNTDASRLPPRVVHKYLMPSERVVVAVRMNPAAIISPVLLILVGAALAGLLTEVAHGNGWLVLAIWLLWGVLFVRQGWKVATWSRRYFVVTQNRLMMVTSLVFTEVVMMPLARVTELRLHESMFGRMLHYGEFIVESAGPQALSSIRFVPNPARIYQDVLSLTFLKEPAAAGPQRPAESQGTQRPLEHAQRQSGPSWPGNPSPRASAERSERPGDDPGF